MHTPVLTVDKRLSHLCGCQEIKVGSLKPHLWSCFPQGWDTPTDT